jgi:3-oxoacyl-[acyl-carrier-protein] synthase-3
MVANKKYRYVLVVGAEKLSTIVNWEDRSTCVLFGDGAGAILLENVDDGSDSGLIASDMNTDGNWSDILKLPGGGSVNPASHETVDAKLHAIHMQGQETFKLAVNAMVDASRKVVEAAGKTIENDVKLVIPHQANDRIIQAVAKRLELRDDQVICNIDRYGNTSAASIPICLDEAVRAGRLKRGDLVLFTSFGSGLAWGAQLYRY